MFKCKSLLTISTQIIFDFFFIRISLCTDNQDRPTRGGTIDSQLELVFFFCFILVDARILYANWPGNRTCPVFDTMLNKDLLGRTRRNNNERRQKKNTHNTKCGENIFPSPFSLYLKQKSHPLSLIRS